MRRVAVVLLAIGLLGTAAATEEIGIAMLVRPQVVAFPPGEPSRDLVARDPIERGLKVRLTGREAFLKVDFTRAFGCKQAPASFDGRRISGVLTLLGPSDAELGDRARSCAPRKPLRASRGPTPRSSSIPTSGPSCAWSREPSGCRRRPAASA
jgi:hypothetical protein